MQNNILSLAAHTSRRTRASGVSEGPRQVVSQKDQGKWCLRRKKKFRRDELIGKKTVIIQVDEDFPILIFQPRIHGTLKFSIHCPGLTPGF